MSNITFSQQLAQRYYDSAEQFPIDFNDAWLWLEYSRKNNAKRNFMTLGFVENVDYVLLNSEQSLNHRGFSVQSKGAASRLEKIMLTCECLKQWGMMAGTPKGKEIRMYFLECERIAKQSQKPQYYIGMVTEEPKRWTEHFDPEFIAHAERLTELEWWQRPMAHFINRCVYRYFPKEVREELNRVNPTDNKGYRKNKQHQHIVMEKELRAHIDKVKFIMGMAPNLKLFYYMCDLKFGSALQLQLPFIDMEEN